MRYHQFFQALLLLAALLLNPRVSLAQSGSNWLLPPPSTITRDPAALSLLQSALAAMNPQNLPPIVDQVLTGTVSKWLGAAATGTIAENSIGLTSQSVLVMTNGQQSYYSLRVNGTESVTGPNNNTITFSDQRLYEDLPITPVFLIQDLLLNPLDEVELIAGSDPAATEQILKVTVRPPFWIPAVRDTASATLFLLVDQTSFLPTRIFSNRHFDGLLLHTLPHVVAYSNYQLQSGWMVPGTIEERHAGRVVNDFAITQILFNTGLTAATVDTK